VATDDAIEQRLGEAPKDEDVKERLEREHTELLEELRALIPGAQVLFGFLLAICFTSPLFILWLIARLLARLLVLPDADDGAKDLEILVLRHQLRVLRRKTSRPRFTTRDRVLLAATSRALPRQRWASFLVTPQTLLRWHRTLVRRKWTYGRERTPGRPPIDPQIVELVLRMASENSRWGCVRICGELRKLGIRVGATTIRALLRRHGLGPAPRRLGPTWAQFLRVQAEGIVACDFLRWRRFGSRPSTCCSSSTSAPGESSRPR
jgi:hypothetical protein